MRAFAKQRNVTYGAYTKMEPKALYFTGFGFRKTTRKRRARGRELGLSYAWTRTRSGSRTPEKPSYLHHTLRVVIQAETHSTRANSLEGTMLPITARDAAFFYLLESAKLLKLKSTDDDGFGNYYCLSGLI